ncbi:MAG: D-alanyl-D-alanine carboxypeptidase, partial [Alphaproteobacteria bacterium]|nr:D-alanyl-D-alanine carboxypeptidase [Alphaproteobacteria bacterium]
TDRFPVSEKAWRMQGSKTFVGIGDTIAVEDLIRGIIIQSGNDACIVVAEGVSGSEEALAARLNQIAQTIGLTHSHFVNATGWPDEGHLMSAHDLAILARRLITDFPEFYHYFGEQSFTYGNITQQNRNRLLGRDLGVDGLKTGHTDVAGYGITLSAKNAKSGRRLILVINGLESDNARVAEGERLLRWGFSEFENHTLLKAGEVVEEAPVWLGRNATVPLAAGKDVAVTLPVAGAAPPKFTLTYASPIPAPVAKGAHVADLHIAVPNRPEIVVPLLAAEDVPKLGWLGRIAAGLRYKLTGKAP